MNQSNNSVIYVIDPSTKSLDESSLGVAQQFAIKHKLPMAVALGLESATKDKLLDLLPIEKRLAEFNIPFIVLIGDPNKTLAGLIHYTKPLKVFTYQDSDNRQDGALVKHAFSWPGKVIGLEKLSELYQQGRIVC